MVSCHGGKLVARGLKRHGVTHLFTLCGGHIQAIYDGCLDVGIRVVDTRHEQTAGHAADGYARMTGRPGVCAVTAGPGVTNVVTAVANAFRAGIPMVVLGGAGPKILCDMGSLQDMDHVALMRSITKWSVQVPETGRIQEYVDSAMRVAQAGVPGPVFLELPLDLLMNEAEDEAPLTRALEAPPRPAGDPQSVLKAAALLAKAQRPVVLVGSQLRWTPRPEALLNLANTLCAPFYLNGMARGALPLTHPNLMTQSRKAALAQADVVAVFGTPFDFRVGYARPGTWAQDARIVQVDLDGAELGRNRAVDVGIHGDTGLVMEQLAACLGNTQNATAWRSQMRTLEDQKKHSMLEEINAASDPPNPLAVCHAVGQRLGPRDVVVGDGGDFVATAAYVLKMQWPQVWMDPGPLGSLGVGPGYAMAAALMRPDARTVLMYGDGSFGMHALEFEAMVRQKIPVVAVIGNDAAWTQIRRGQVELYGEDRAPATALAYTRYDQVVEALGGRGFYVEKSNQLGPALDAAFAAKVPACVNVKIASSEFRKGSLSV